MNGAVKFIKIRRDRAEDDCGESLELWCATIEAPTSILVINTDITEKKRMEGSFFALSGWNPSALLPVASPTISTMYCRQS